MAGRDCRGRSTAGGIRVFRWLELRCATPFRMRRKFAAHYYYCIVRLVDAVKDKCLGHLMFCQLKKVRLCGRYEWNRRRQDSVPLL